MKETTPRIIWMVSLLVCLLCAGALGYLIAGGAKKKALLFQEDTLPKLAYSARLNALQAEGYAQLLRMIETDDAAKRHAYEMQGVRFREQIDAILGAYDTAITGEDQAGRRYFTNFVKKRQRYREVAHHVLDLLASGQATTARALGETGLARAYREYTGAGDVLFDYELVTGTTRAEEIENACANAQLLTACMCIALFFAGLFSPLILALLFVAKPPAVEVPGSGAVV